MRSPARKTVVSHQLSAISYQLSALSFKLLVISFLIPVFLVFPKMVLAADDSGTPLTSSTYKAPQNADYSLMNMMHGALCQLAGTSPMGKCLGAKSDGKTVSLAAYDQVPGGGALGLTGNVLAVLYTKPTSTTEYLADVGRNIGIIKTVDAQSVLNSSGGQVLKPVYKMWQFIQKLSYLAFVIVFLVVGFMIMLRKRINPQTVISIQSALPGLVIGLILVTFSYFIATLSVDLSFTGVQVVAGIFNPANTGPNAFGNAQDIKNLANNSNIFQMFAAQALRPTDRIGDIFSGVSDTISSNSEFRNIASITSGVMGVIIGGFLGPAGFLASLPIKAGGGVAGGVAGPPFFLPGLISLLVPLILIIAMFVQMFRLLFHLIKAYISILVATVFGPLIILASAMPGQGRALSLWWKMLVGNALIFPAVFGVILFAGLILGSPLTDWSNTLPLFGGLSTELLKIIIGYGVILGIASIPDMVKKAIGVPDIKGLPEAALAGFTGGFTVGRTGYGKLTEGPRKDIQAYQEALLKNQAATRAAPPAGGGPQPPPGWRWRWLLGG